jgi:glycosyltransferase involved in cell wall biosynthesis
VIDLSVIVPVYNAQECLRELHARLTAVLTGMGCSYEIVLVDDRSRDASWAVTSALARADVHVRAIRLSRNFGQHAAITAGLAECEGEWAVVMDCDLQDPPEEIPQLYAKAREGFDVVLARRVHRKHSWFRRGAARAYAAILARFNRLQFDGSHGSFSIISRRVIDAFLGVGDTARHYLHLLGWLGFDIAHVDYEHGQRFAGRSSYRLGTLLRHAADGVFFQTTVLLRWIVYAGFAVAAGGVLLAAWVVYEYFSSTLLPGWASLAILVLLLGGAIIVSVGVVGLYVGKIFDQVKDRPLYVIGRRIVKGIEQ